MVKVGLIILCITVSLNAMQKRAGEEGKESPAKRTRIEKETTVPETPPITELLPLPNDVQLLLIKNIVENAATLADAIRDIQSLARTNTTYRAFINSADVTERIIYILARRFTNGDCFNAARALSTPGAQAWYHSYPPQNLRNNPIFKRLAYPNLKNKSLQRRKEFIKQQWSLLIANASLKHFFADPLLVMWLIKHLTWTYIAPILPGASTLYVAELLFSLDPTLFNLRQTSHPILRQWLAHQPRSVIVATRIGNTQFLEYLLQERTIAINAVNQDGNNALMELILNPPVNGENFDLEKVLNLSRILIRHGINVNQANNGGFIILQAAMDLDYPPLIELLLKSGTNLQWQDQYGNTLLHWACFNFFQDLNVQEYQDARHAIQIIALILRHGVNPATTHEGHLTPLQEVTAYHNDLIREEQEQGTDLNQELTLVREVEALFGMPT